MNTQQIAYFTAVARCLNFTQAAEEVHLSQPALSKQIASLENELGIKLFIRTSHFVRLTPAGVVLLKELNHISTLLENACEKAREANAGITNTLRVGCLEAIDINEFLPDAVTSFMKEYPNIKLNLERKSFKALLDALCADTLDIIFTYSFEVQDEPDLSWKTIVEASGSIVIHKNHPLADNPIINPADLSRDPLIIISENESYKGNSALLSLLAMNGLFPVTVKQAPNLESILLNLELGVGYSVLSRYNRLYRNPSLRFIDLEQSPKIGIVAVWKNDVQNSAVVLFLEEISKRCLPSKRSQ